MTGFQSGSSIDIDTAHTAITIVGNAAVFDAAGGKGSFFFVEQAVALVMSNVTLQNGNAYDGGAIYVSGGTITLSDCSFNGNTAALGGDGGAIYVQNGGTITLSDCSFNGNTATGYGGGALDFRSGSNGLLKNCSLLGTVSPKNNDIVRDTTANVTFACADGEVGTPVQMSGTETTRIPALTCTAQTYACYNGGKANWKCVPDSTSPATPAQCDAVCAP
jgi:predicted outer membrane repeat protein